MRPLALVHAYATPQHAPVVEYTAFLQQVYPNPDTQRTYQTWYRRFVQSYPDLQTWFAAPLLQRVGRRYDDQPPNWFHPISYFARRYLFFLACRGYTTFDWAWLIALPDIHIRSFLDDAGLLPGFERLVEHAIQLGYSPRSAHSRIGWMLARIFLHHGFFPIEHLNETHLNEIVAAVRQFHTHPDMLLFWGSTQRYHKMQTMVVAAAHKLHVILYHCNQTPTEPRVIMPLYAHRPVLRPDMEAVAARYIAERRVRDRPGSISALDVALRHFIAWCVEWHPHITAFTQVTREHVLQFIEQLDHAPNAKTCKPLAVCTKRGRISNLSRFFRDTCEWAWEGAPKRPLLGLGDIPKMPLRIPRYIPDEELTRFMRAVRNVPCPYQRAALLIARWSGARRGEISRLPLDCLDTYPDGSARLRIPAGKTYTERIIPLHEEAAHAIRDLQKLHAGGRGFRDPHTGIETRYLFMHFGKRFSTTYLFGNALKQVCAEAGLVDGTGKPLISAHRLRHTMGTQLAERGAKLHTIMQILGHTSAGMSMVYAKISDREVLREYQAVLGPGATLAGPAAAAVRAGELPATAVEWIKTNFFKTELELGHCLRLPQEGPCECDLYLQCAKFVTTAEYAPRLRQRYQREQTLIADATARGWQREVERHQCTVRRIEQLLIDLGEPLITRDGGDVVATEGAP